MLIRSLVTAAFLAAPLSVTATETSTDSGRKTIVVANLNEAGAGAEAQPQISPAGERLRAALREEGASKSVTSFYQERAFEPVWFGPNGAARVEALLSALTRAAEHALPADRYNGQALATRVRALAEMEAEARLTEEAALEADLSRALALYGGDLTAGVLKPRRIDAEMHIFPERPDGAVLLGGLVTAQDPALYLASLAPRSPLYAALMGRYTAFLADTPDWGVAVGGGRSIRPGETSARVAAMRARLVALGDLSADGAARSTLLGAAQAPAPDPLVETVFDPAMVEAVRAFQRRHGLNDDGVAGRRTIAALNVSAEERLRQMAVGLERMRWLNKEFGDRHIVVNQADFRMSLMDGDRVTLESRVVIGKSRKHRTPEFSDEMTHMVVNPTWNVPKSIAGEEILPQLQADPTYLSRKNMRLIPKGAEPAPLDPEFHDWSLYSKNDFPFRVKQAPGRGNALGRVKFMFPNKFAIYLHDTPSKSLFRKDARAFSHGCVRVQKPFELAHALLAPQEADPEGRFSRWLDARSERWVNLKTPVPVHLIYRTAWVDADGRDQFRDDIYGRDRKIWRALEKAGLQSPGA